MCLLQSRVSKIFVGYCHVAVVGESCPPLTISGEYRSLEDGCGNVIRWRYESSGSSRTLKVGNESHVANVRLKMRAMGALKPNCLDVREDESLDLKFTTGIAKGQ